MLFRAPKQRVLCFGKKAPFLLFVTTTMALAPAFAWLSGASFSETSPVQVQTNSGQDITPESIPVLLNGDFSQATENSAPSHWTFERADILRSTWVLDGQESVSTPQSVRIEVLNNSAQLSQSLKRIPTKPSVLKAQVKALRSSQHPLSVQGELRFWSADGVALPTHSIPVSISDGWQAVSAAISVPEGSAKAQIVFEVVGVGSIWLDDIQISEISSE